MSRILAALRGLSKAKRIGILAAVFALLTALTASGCSSSGGGGDDVAAPAAYGRQVGGTYHCYVVNDGYNDAQAQLAALVHAGHCPPTAVAYPMPLDWEETYWAYYSSPAYYAVYIPAPYRTHYTSVTVVSFSRTYSRQITLAESGARYKTSSGRIVTGTSKVKFSSGNGVSAGHGGGSGRSGCSLNMTVVQDRGGSGGGGHGGGSGRGGTSGSSSGKSGTSGKTSTGGKSGC